MLRSRLSLGLAAAATVLVAVALLRRRRRNSSILGESYDAKGLPQAMPPLSITPGTSAPAAAQQAPAPAAATTPAEVKQEAPNGGGSGRRARGSAVLLQGLQAKPEFNGREGRVLSYDEGRGRYSVRLLPTGSHAAKTLQVKPDNLADAPPKGQELSCAELCLLTLGEHASITAEQMHRVIEFLSGQHGQMTEADLSLLLRVVCCFGWHVASHRDRGTGGEAPCLIAHPEHGSGLVVVTQPERLGSISQVVGHPTPQGAAKCATLVNGADLFLSESMERAQYLSLNPEDPTPAGPGRFTMLTTPVFPALKFMASGLRLEAALPAVAAACEAGGGYGAESELFCNHTFFCFDTCQGGAGVMPLNAVAEEGSFMMLFTGPELLELAKPALQQLGAFSVAPNVQIAQVHAKNVFDCLNAKDAMHAGVAVNVYVPGLDERYMAAGLRKAPLCKLFAHHGILV